MTPALRLVCASANPHKIDEIAAIFGDAVELVPRPATVPDVVEDGDTLLDNARLKARAICAATGVAAVADDTGLEVDALDGAPGVHSARYAGEEAIAANNVAKLLAELADRPAPARTARFRTVALVVRPDGSEVVAEGIVEGHITDGPRGSDGFGYDPVFVPEGADGRTFAEMTAADKNAISHRGRAFRALAALLAGLALVLGACGSNDESIDSGAWKSAVSNQLREGFFDLIAGDPRVRSAVLDLAADDEPDLHREITADGVVTRHELRSTSVSMNMVNGFSSAFWTSVGGAEFSDPIALRALLSDRLSDHVVSYLHDISSLQAALTPGGVDAPTVAEFGEVPAVRELADGLARQVLFHVDDLLEVAGQR